MEINKINANTKMLGLIGNPVAHSLSPLLHGELSRSYQEQYAYLAFPVAQENLETAVKGAWALGAQGLNVTVPYKREVMNYLSDVEPKAELIGAVNTLVRMEAGYCGYNTDMPGLKKALKHDGICVAGANVVLIGAGGVANAALCMLLEEEAANILILNRTKEKAAKLAEHFMPHYPNAVIRVASLQEDYIALMDEISSERQWIAIQATSVGMHPQITETPIDAMEFYERITEGVDLIFNPEETRFLSLIRQSGHKGYNGLKMLLFQGIIAYELWTGHKVEEDVAEKILTVLQEELKSRA